MTYAIMGLVLLFMAFILIYKAKLTKDTSHFLILPIPQQCEDFGAL